MSDTTLANHTSIPDKSNPGPFLVQRETFRRIYDTEIDIDQCTIMARQHKTDAPGAMSMDDAICNAVSKEKFQAFLDTEFYAKDGFHCAIIGLRGNDILPRGCMFRFWFELTPDRDLLLLAPMEALSTPDAATTDEQK